MILRLGLGIISYLKRDWIREEILKKFPYCVEYYHAYPIIGGFNDLKSARKFALDNTIGLYRINGQLNERKARIFENGKHIETIISGFTESEYNKIKAEQETNEGESVKSVVSFSWNAPPKK